MSNLAETGLEAHEGMDMTGDVSGTRTTGIRRAERLFDLVGLCLLGPILFVPGALVALAVLLDSPGSILYRARRVGLGGRTFTMLKFRTMRTDAQGSVLTAPADERITPVGRFLRASRLDELPQLWNVLRGDMRLVGPRPEDPEFIAMFEDQYRLILSLRPGITGPTQVEYAIAEAEMLAGHEDPRHLYAEEVMPHKLAIDLAYVRSHGLLGDLRILAETLVLPLGLLGGRLLLALRRPAVGIYLVAIGAIALLALTFVLGAGSTR